jgi:hypothetical protein
MQAVLGIKGIHAPVCECSACQDGAAGCGAREVVVAVLTHRGAIAVFRRSSRVSSDRGLWHCVSGYRPAARCPLAQVSSEIAEETGMRADRLTLRRRLELVEHGSHGEAWRIHAFHFETDTVDVRLNWEHDAVRWIAPQGIAQLRTVTWFGRILQVLDVVAPDTGANSNRRSVSCR